MEAKDNIYERLDKIEATLKLFEEKILKVTPREPLIAAEANVNSSMISAYKYNSDTKTLILTFRTGMRYKYLDVPRDIMIKFQHADSYGKFINEKIKPHFKGERVDGDVKEKKEAAPQKVETLPLDLVIELKQFAEANAASAAAIKTYIDALVKKIEASQRRGV